MSKRDDWPPKAGHAGASRETRNEAVKLALAAMGGQSVPAEDLVRSADIISRFINDGTLPETEATS